MDRWKIDVTGVLSFDIYIPLLPCRYFILFVCILGINELEISKTDNIFIDDKEF